MSTSRMLKIQEQPCVVRPADQGGRVTDAAGRRLEIALLTGGGDKPYALGLGTALISQGIVMDFIGSDDLDTPELRANPQVNFLNLRGNQSPNASRAEKMFRVIRYYLRLMRYAVSARPKVFHLLWNNKFELFDRTVLMLGYRLLGKRIVFTAHNVNAGKRDANDSLANRLSLRVQYRLADHIFVHTEKMKREMSADFGVPESKITVIPFGINQTLPNSALTVAEAKQLLGVSPNQKTLLFFGHIAPYKGLDCLIAAMAQLARTDSRYRLIIAGRPKGYDAYWASMQQMIAGGNLEDKVIQRITFIPDDGVELYFKAADVLVLPYTHIFQSGVLLLGYNFGLPVVATDVGSLREDIIEGKTGYLCRAQDPQDLARAIEAYFASDLFRQLDERRGKIQAYAKERYSWDAVGTITKRVYRQLLAH